jgi:hypothetical protein
MAATTAVVPNAGAFVAAVVQAGSSAHPRQALEEPQPAVNQQEQAAVSSNHVAEKQRMHTSSVQQQKKKNPLF